MAININNKIEELLASFYDGSTTKEEEQILKEYFLENENIPTHLQADRELFENLMNANYDMIPLGFEDRLDVFIDSLEDKYSRNKRHNWRWVSSIAASLIIVIGIGLVYLGLDESRAKIATKDTCATVDEAYLEAEKALLLISENINKGNAKYDEAQTKVDDVARRLNNKFK